MSLNSVLDTYCRDNVSLYSFVCIKGFEDFIVDEGLRKYSYAVSIGIRVPDEVLDELPNEVAEVEYLNAYNRINERLNVVSKEIEDLITGYGYGARAVNSSLILPNGNLEREVSHKFIAHLGGLGWIGKSCLLITPEFGPRVRWSSVLTDYPLTTNRKPLESRCGGCSVCVDSCPAGAFKNVEFRVGDERSVRYNAYACKKRFEKLESENRLRLCGICVKVCPWGQKK